MRDERMALIDLIEKGADADLVRELLAFAADRTMELEVEAKTGVPAGARSPDRLTQRNGSPQARTPAKLGLERARRDFGGNTPAAHRLSRGSPRSAIVRIFAVVSR